ncbi:calpain-like cysteine peptidase [Trypanosoma grayi]|uniref:calpain-like cysteine peptidase n=1 Tax=Trypanosoma grayi TaxID=71804 RepID=UPI0004F4711C|nr:calpain-like cysteine peptidase [Trypanosoma grayi]KEG09390.1 calpain-like cysteine peptidase [Trypanosoma grayi]
MPCCCCTGRDTKEKYVLRQGDKDTKPVKKTRKFKFGGPTHRGSAYALLDDGNFYRVEDGKQWLLYNDTLSCEMHLTMRFSADTRIEAGKRTQLKIEGKERVATIVVYPLETLPFLKFDTSKVDYLKSRSLARPLTQEYLKKVNAETNAKLQRERREVSRICSHSYSEEELLHKCRHTKNTMYVDLKFSPCALSLQRPTDKKKVVNVPNIVWKRTADYIPADRHKDIQLFRDGIDPEDIDQGQLGDCWLMCALSVIAGRPSIVKGIFRHPVSSSKAKKEQKCGAYRVTVNKHGWWENVIVDSYLPTMNCQPLFARCSRDPCELWVSFVEKAYAKLHGSYAGIIGGDALFALQDFTGFPVLSFEAVWSKAARNSDAASAFFKSLRRYQEKGYMITIGTPGKDTSAYTGQQQSGKGSNGAMQDRYKRAGLGMGHAYSVLDVRQFSLPSIKLLKVRNPWGGNGVEWTGAWSDKSDKWKSHPLVRRACKPSKKNDGTFWMEWEDIVRYFDGGGVCMVRKNWHDYRVRGVFLGLTPSVVLEVVVTRKVKVVLVLSQQDRRALHPDDPNALYKGLLLSVGAYSREKQRHVLHANSSADPEEPSPETFTFTISRDIGMELTLLPQHSPYYIIPRVMANKPETPKKFTLGLLSPCKVGSGGLAVNFKKLPPTHDAFKNRRDYTTLEAAPLHVEFQHKKPGKCAVLRGGDSIQNSKKIQ